MTDEESLNLDPISQEPGAHPVGAGAALGGASAGAADGAFGGPVGEVVGVVGAIAGGLGGKAVAESVNPTLGEAYWRDNYNRESYYESSRAFDGYGPVCRLELQGHAAYDGNFEDVDSRLAGEWHIQHERSSLSWEQARAASPALVDNDDVIDTLNDLLESCRDGEFGFNIAAEHARSADIKTMRRCGMPPNAVRRARSCRRGSAI